MEKAAAFIRRDYTIESSYKFAFVLQFISAVSPVLSFFFISKLVSGQPNGPLAKYGGEYFPFVVIGLAFSQYFMTALRTFAGTIRRGQMAGCLEAMLSTKTRPATVILMSSLYSFFMKSTHIFVILLISWALLGVDFGQANFFSACIVLVLSIVSFSSLGIFSAAFITVLKKGDPIEWILGTLGSLLGGAMFPVELLPSWLRPVSAILPITHALDAMRLAMLEGHSIIQLWKQLAVLGGMAVVLLPLSVWSFSLAVEKGRRDGSLTHY